MTRIRWSPEAVDDLESISAFVARDSPHYAKVVVQRLVAAIERLVAFPMMGRVVPEVGNPEVRETIVGAFRIVYRYRHDTVEVVTIFRGARLFQNRQD